VVAHPAMLNANIVERLTPPATFDNSGSIVVLLIDVREPVLFRCFPRHHFLWPSYVIPVAIVRALSVSGGALNGVFDRQTNEPMGVSEIAVVRPL
jgi:hypothetical protein